MSEREIRKVLEQFCEDVDAGRVKVSRMGRIRKLVTPPLLGLTLGMGVACESASDYGAPMPPRDGGDIGAIADYMAPADQYVPPTDMTDQGGWPDYMAPMDTVPPPTDGVAPPDLTDQGAVADYMGPMDTVPPTDKGSQG
jgi:hypothetical protein